MEERMKRSAYERLKRTVHEAIDGRDVRTGFEKTFIVSVSTLILFNLAAAILETVPALLARYGWFFERFEVASVTVFTVEYFVRVWSCTADPRFAHPITGRLRFMGSRLMLLDLLSILPFFVATGFLDLRLLRLFRLARFLRVLKLGRYSESIRTLGRVLRAKRSELGVAASAALMLLLIASTLMYFAENGHQPKVFSSIPAAMWWAVVTLTTVGYGDVYPMTPVGRILASLLAFSAIGLFALPAGILASGFSEEMRKRSGKSRTCPHCGKAID